MKATIDVVISDADYAFELESINNIISGYLKKKNIPYYSTIVGSEEDGKQISVVGGN